MSYASFIASKRQTESDGGFEPVFMPRCLDRDLPANLAAGWVESGRSWIPSCGCYQILLSWDGENPPEVVRS